MNFIIENWELISLVLLLIFMVIREIAKLTKTKKDDQFVQYISDRLENFGVKLDLTPSYVVDKVSQKLKEDKPVINISAAQENPKQRE